MALKLRNEKDPHQTLSLTDETWYGILDLAEDHGWNPLGAVLPGQLPGHWFDLDYSLDGYYLGLQEHWDEQEDPDSRLVVLEDTLNLADALERAFMEYEPAFVPASFFYFAPLDPSLEAQPSIGAISAVIDFCRQGAFWIECYERRDLDEG